MRSRIYRFPDLRLAGVPFTRKHIRTLESRGEFPQHVDLTDFSIGWVAEEVDSWVEKRIRRRQLKPPTTGDVGKTNNTPSSQPAATQP